MDFKEVLQNRYKLSDKEWEETIKKFIPKQLMAKDFFLKQGSISDKIGILQSGLMRSFVYNDKGDEVTTHFFLPGTVVISIDSFNNQVAAQENIVAIEDSILLVISYEKMQELYQSITVWPQICIDVSEMKNQNLTARSVHFQTLSASERYELFCRDYPDILQKVALRHIASYLGIDIATLSRIRKKK